MTKVVLYVSFLKQKGSQPKERKAAEPFDPDLFLSCDNEQCSEVVA